MPRFLSSLAILILSAFAGAVADDGGNLLIDGRFDADQTDFPEFWTSSSATHVVYDRSGGPLRRRASIGLRGEGAKTGVNRWLEYLDQHAPENQLVKRGSK